MTYLAAAGLLLGVLATANGDIGVVEHRARVDHHAGAVDAAYRARVDVQHRQVGAVTPGGRPSTLRCLWSANVTVDRAAYHPSGAMLSRSLDGGAAIEGQRVGWCDTNRAAIAREVATRIDRVRAHVEILAAEDHAVLRAELDQAAARAT